MLFGVFVLLCAVSVLGSLGNLVIIGAVCLSRRLRNRGNVFVVNLAVADLIITAYIMPVGLATSQWPGIENYTFVDEVVYWGWQNATEFNVLMNPLGERLCEVNAFLILTVCGVSTQSLMMIAIERYTHICKPACYKRLFTRPIISVMVAFTWLYTAIWTCQGYTGWTLYVYGEDAWVCLFAGPYSVSYDVCLAVFGMLLPMMVLSFCYLNIFRTVHQSKTNMRAQKKQISAAGAAADPALAAVYRQQRRRVRREQRLVMMLFTIVMVFCACWLPAAIVLPLSGAWPGMPRLLYAVAVWMALCNSAVNSIIYGAMNKNFRSGYMTLFKYIFFCCYGKHKCFRKRKGDESMSTSQCGKHTSPDTSTSQEPVSKGSTIATTLDSLPRKTNGVQKEHRLSTNLKQRKSSLKYEKKTNYGTANDDQAFEMTNMPSSKNQHTPVKEYEQSTNTGFVASKEQENTADNQITWPQQENNSYRCMSPGDISMDIVHDNGRTNGLHEQNGYNEVVFYSKV